jgi:acyl-CoA synthetase (AMP-forming)/AMP-acid ligase II
MVFSGYFDDPVATDAAFDDGWYRTGDRAEVDDEGFLSIVGRVGEMIRTGGEAVAPPEVEAVLVEHPEVADAAVVGIADPDWGEVVCALLVPVGDGASLDVAAVRSHCEGRLAPHKQPRRIELVDRIPRTAATGQVRRPLLAESLAGGVTA